MLCKLCPHGTIHPAAEPCTCGKCVRDRQVDNRRRNAKPKRKQWNTAAYRKAAAAVRARADYRCERCGKPGRSVHHGNLPAHRWREWENLCATCHGREDGAGTPAIIQEPRRRDELPSF